MSRKLLKRIIFGFIFLLIAGYAVFQSQKILHGASVTISSPQDESVVDSPLITVKGVAHQAARITLNDGPIFSDPAGNFSEETVFAPGMNKIKIEVEDRYKNKNTEILSIFYDKPFAAPPAFSASSTPPKTVSSTASTTRNVSSSTPER